MRIIAISDTHNQHNKIDLPEGDLLIHAGDATLRGTLPEVSIFGLWLEKQVSKFENIIFVPGNHDFLFETDEYLARKLLPDSVFTLIDDYVIIEGIKFYGSPWTPLFRDWAFMKNDLTELADYFVEISSDTQILITHGPPYSILDKNETENCGSKALCLRIKNLKRLRHHIFGHIHEAFGEKIIGDVTFHNVSSLNGNYEYTNGVTTFEI